MHTVRTKRSDTTSVYALILVLPQFKRGSVHEWTGIIAVSLVASSLWLLVARCLTQTNPRHSVLGAVYPRGPWGSRETERDRKKREAGKGKGMCVVCVCWLAESPWGSTVKLSSVVVSGICSLSLRERECWQWHWEISAYRDLAQLVWA